MENANPFCFLLCVFLQASVASIHSLNDSISNASRLQDASFREREEKLRDRERLLEKLELERLASLETVKYLSKDMEMEKV